MSQGQSRRGSQRGTDPTEEWPQLSEEFQKVDRPLILTASGSETGECFLHEGEDLPRQRARNWDLRPWYPVCLTNIEPSQCGDGLNVKRHQQGLSSTPSRSPPVSGSCCHTLHDGHSPPNARLRRCGPQTPCSLALRRTASRRE